MCKRHFGFLLVVVLLLAGQAVAQGPGSIYVSTFSDHKILRIDGTTITTVHDGSQLGELPEGLVVGPDNRVYYCDSVNGRIFRMDLNGSNWEKVYSRTTQTTPQGPEGPTFNGAGDLIFNTRSTSSGVWKIPGVAGIGYPGTFPAPVQIFSSAGPPVGTGSTWGEGTTFAPDGTLLMVDRSNNRVVKSSPPYNVTSVLISSGLDSPIGIAVNSAGHIFVANGGTSNNIMQFDASGGSQSVFTSFTGNDGNDSPIFMRFDPGTGNLLVATSLNDLDHGKVWSVDSSGTKALVKALPCSECTPPPAVGLGVIPTSASITQSFDPNHTSRTYDFGTDTVTLSFPGGVLTSFTLTYTRTDVSPAEFNAELAPPLTTASLVSTGPFPPGTTCFHYPSENGFCTPYSATGTVMRNPGPPQPGLPQQGTDYNGDYRLKIAFFTQDKIQNPGMAHEHELSKFYDEDMLIFFSPSATPGSDPAGAGQSGGFSKFAMVNKPLVQNGNFCGFKPPLNISGRSFEVGESIDVEFRLTTGANCTGNTIRNAVARISVSKMVGQNFVLVPDIQGSRRSNGGNLFRFDDGEYEFELRTRRLGGAGTYMITVTSDSFTPKSVLFKLRGKDD